MNFSSEKQISVIGGAGNAGVSIIRQLLKYTDASINILDIREINIKENFPEYSERVSFQKADLLRSETIPPMLKDSSLVINSAGPFFRFGALAAKTVIDSGIAGIDICNDYSATSAILSMDENAKQKGTLYITGVGFSPGLSNLLVAKASYGMEHIQNIEINTVFPANKQFGQALTEHFMYTALNKIPVFENGKRKLADSFSEPSKERFPYPLNLKRISLIGGSEVISLPEFIGADNIKVKGAILPPVLEKSIIWSAFSGFTRDELSRKKLASVLNKAVSFGTGLSVLSPVDKAALSISVRGKRKGSTVEISVSAVDSFENMVSLPAVAAAIMILNGEIRNKGVFAPEGCLDENKILGYISKMGMVYNFSEKYIYISL